jgi:hypothetical protein
MPSSCVELPELPEAVVTDDAEALLIDSEWSWRDQTLALKESRAYEE